MAQPEIQELLKLEIEGLSPSGNARRLITILPEGLLAHLAKTGDRSKIEEAWLIPDVCDMPSGIWRGLDRNDQHEAYCYAGATLGAFALEHNRKIEIPPHKLFLIYLTPTLEVAKWCFCRPDPDRPEFPINHGTRFGERLWPTD